MRCECWLICALVLAAVVARSDAAPAENPAASEEEQKTECAPVDCALPPCREVIGRDGCPTCLCGPACTPPKCDPGCRIEFNNSLGPCPGCVCDGEENGQDIFSFALPHSSSVRECQCDWRYLKHYATKKCTPVFEEGCDCPVKFECPEVSTVPDTVCEYKGKTFQQGEKIETSSPCEICSCLRSFYGGVEISCIPIECPSLFGPPPEDGCYEVFEADKCCSVGKKCVTAESEANGTEPTCEYKGRTYHIGQHIYPEEDPCMSCLCDENWDGPHNKSCHFHECLIERNLGNLKRGCIPIYHEKTCCPIEYHCGTEGEGNLNETVAFNSADGGCVFEGKTYSVGEVLDIKHPTNCVACTCRTPPDFTCVHMSCPRPPNDDYDNCRPTYNEGACCPVYDCEPPELPSIICDPVKCVNGCKEVWAPSGCSLCQCDAVLCAPPSCPDACEVEYDVKPGNCPYCKCPVSLQFAPPLCDPVRCDPQCFEAIGSNGCPTCLCGPLCSPPKCEEGCDLNTDVAQGQCPGCVCHSTLDHGHLDAGNIQCAPVKCPPACHEAVGQFGCPTCLCHPLCSPPRCDPGCEVERIPSSGPCPGCVCKDRQIGNIQCAPPKCDPGCEIEKAPFAGPCPGCVCGDQIVPDILCSPPKCDPGCEIEKAPFSGPCPGCVCGDQRVPLIHTIQCSPPKCDPGCEIEKAPFSGPCPGCVCGDQIAPSIPAIQCSPPKCDPGCEIEKAPFSGPCPGCVCGDQIVPVIQCSPPKCDPGCEIEKAPFEGPCPGCVCGGALLKPSIFDVQCSPPKCDPGCEIEKAPFSGPCPGCVCGGQIAPVIQCSPPKCDPGCEVEKAPFSGPCPGCVCDDRSFKSLVPEILCSPPKCDPGCEIEKAPFSGPCPGCVCGDKIVPIIQCSPPKCDPGCEIEKAPFKGPCPGCVCDNKAPFIQCSPPNCGPGCEIEKAPFRGPCPGCVCDKPAPVIQCSPPNCGPGCEIEKAPFRGSCPGCVCDKPAPVIQCSPPNCAPGCEIEKAPFRGPCPGCVCDKTDQSRTKRDVWNGYYIYVRK